MSFDVAAESYDRFMGRYSAPLAPQLADLAGIEPGQRVLDVGCGPGALTAELVGRVGAENVEAVDPSARFVEAVHERLPEVRVQQAFAEELPFRAESFDAALAQLVVHFMSDPVAGLREMRRVTRTGGIVAACVWDLGGDRSPLSVYWQGVHSVYPVAPDESARPGSREGELAELFVAAGLSVIEDTDLSVSVEHPTFDEWWEPFTLGVGPAGGFVRKLDEDQQAEIREACRALLPPAPFTLTVSAWAVTGTP
jgi:SAM-dependent methyltransferase